MKLAIPVDEKSTDAAVSASFGRASYFFIYDVETDESSYLENTAIQAQGGAGIKAAQSIIDENVNVLLTTRCGENAAEAFHEAGISIYKVKYPTINENIAAFRKEELVTLTELQASVYRRR